MLVSSTVPQYLQLLETPAGPERHTAWVDRYEAAHPEVFTTYYSSWGNPVRRQTAADLVEVHAPMMEGREQRVVTFAAEAGTALCDLGLLDTPDLPVVVLVGVGSSNGWVALHRGLPTLFIALEFLTDSVCDNVLVLHEAVHLARQRLTFPAWPGTVLESLVGEGLAVSLSRLLLPGLSDSAYLWFDREHDDWVNQCRRRRGDIRSWPSRRLDYEDEQTLSELFSAQPGSRLPTRSGYWLAAAVMGDLLADGHPPLELMTWPYAAAEAAMVRCLELVI